MSRDPVAVVAPVVTFFGGVVPPSKHEEELAYSIGLAVGKAGLTMQQGGYNGLMEHAARGAAAAGAQVLAVTLNNVNWGEFNPYVTDAIRFATMGERLHRFFDGAELIVAMGGGVGTLHELTAALWYAGNIRTVPVWLAGETALRLSAFLKADRWVFESPTRPLGFLREIPDVAVFHQELAAWIDAAVDRDGLGHTPRARHTA